MDSNNVSHDEDQSSEISLRRTDSPEQSCVSMKSDQSMDPIVKFSEHTDPGFRPDPPDLRCVSLKSDQSMDPIVKFSEHTDPGFRSDPPEPSGVSVKSHQSMDPIVKFSGHTDPGFRTDPPDLSCVSLKSDQSMDPIVKFSGHTDPGFRTDPPDLSCVSLKSDQSMDPIVKFSEHTDPGFRTDLSSTEALDPQLKFGPGFSHDLEHTEALKTFRSNLQKRFERLCEGTALQENPTLLNEIYTELYITEGDSGETNTEHEVRQIETQSRRTQTQDTAIRCTDIFTPLAGQDRACVRSVLTKGVAGIGKTVSVQKFILDWAEGKENQDVQLIFPLPFREINLMKDKTLSLSDLLHLFFPETQEIEISSDRYKVLFIFDGLDECRLSLDFKSGVRLCDISESASVDVLLTNLIQGNLLPSALIWITSRPAAAHLIPSQCVHRLTEVRGFTDPQKEEYFRKRIRDQSLALRIIKHLKSSRSLFIMCHIPVFCWISASVLEEMMRQSLIREQFGMFSQAQTEEIPKTLTEMYTHFLIIQTKIKHGKDYEKTVKDEEMILKLGKLAFQQLVKGNLIFYEEDLSACGIGEAEASVYSGLCTQIFRQESGWYQGKVFCFVHLSIQEHLAALYVLLSFLQDKRDELGENLSSKHTHEFKCLTISDLHQRAVDKALQSDNGHLDLFLRFLLGLSLKKNQTLLKSLLKLVGNTSFSKEKTIEYIKIRIKLNPSPEKSINLFYCLNELGDDSLVNEVQKYVRSGGFSDTRLSSSQWSALVFVLLTSNKVNLFNLNNYISREEKRLMTPDEVLQKLKPVVEASRSAKLSYCKITAEGCAVLGSALRSNSNLRELDLSHNNLGDEGVKRLSDGLKDPHCKLETLTLWHCEITAEGCAVLGSVLRSNSHLRDLNLTWNNLGDEGVKRLSDGLKDPHCKLETLTNTKSCLTPAEEKINLLNFSDHQLLKNIERNTKRNIGKHYLEFSCFDKMQIDLLSRCEITAEGCADLGSALRSNSHLRELDLIDNNLGDEGVKRLSALKDDPLHKLEKLHWR